MAAEHPEIAHIRSVCAKWGALTQQMTGSGATMFAIMSDMDSAKGAVTELKHTYRDVFLARPV